jgi:phage protein U
MMMAWGGFIFTIPTFTIDQISRSIKPRLAQQPVIGRAPIIHRLGPDNETLTFQSTFMPLAWNKKGLPMLSAMQLVVANGISAPLVSLNPISGRNVFGRWIATEISNEETEIGPNNVPQIVKATLSLMRDI